MVKLPVSLWHPGKYWHLCWGDTSWKVCGFWVLPNKYWGRKHTKENLCLVKDPADNPITPTALGRLLPCSWPICVPCWTWWPKIQGNTCQKETELICETRAEGVSPESMVRVQGIAWGAWNFLSLITSSCCGLRACALLLASMVGSVGWDWDWATRKKAQKLSSLRHVWELSSKKQSSQMCLSNLSPNDSEISSFRQKMIGILMQCRENIPLLIASVLWLGENHMNNNTVSTDFTFYTSDVLHSHLGSPFHAAHLSSPCISLFSITYF